MKNLPENLSNKTNKLKIACIGGGYNSAIGRVHQIASQMDQKFEVVAGCFSLEAEENIYTANQYNVSAERTYPSLQDLLQNEAEMIDAIIILTPTDQHAGQVIQCLEMNLPVISEKALATSSEDISSIKKQIKRTKGFLAVTYNYLGYPMIRELKHMISQGYFGRIGQINIEMPQEGFARVGKDGNPVVPQSWRLHDHNVPTVSLDLGVHVHSIVRYLTMESPTELVASSCSQGHFSEVIDNVSCLAKYTNELNCSIWYGKVALGYRNGLKIRVFGNKGAAEWIQEAPEYLHVADAQGNKSVIDRGSGNVTIANQDRYTRFKAGHPAGFIEAFANYYMDIATAIHNRTSQKTAPQHESIYGIDTALEGLKMMEAISESSQQKRWITVQ